MNSAKSFPQNRTGKHTIAIMIGVFTASTLFDCPENLSTSAALPEQ
jgi:hypothetical protein